jgi:hypothetical protein
MTRALLGERTYNSMPAPSATQNGLANDCVRRRETNLSPSAFVGIIVGTPRVNTSLTHGSFAEKSAYVIAAGPTSESMT